MTREKLIDYVSGEYGVQGDNPFADLLGSLVFRHKDNKKWFGLLMTIDFDKLNLQKSGKVDVINVKCDTMMKTAFLQQKGVYPSYHMNKEHWLTLVLSEIEDELLKTLVDISFQLTKTKYKKRKSA
ncbi:MAG: MmcQ/YjbR family DNA-binding protein [Clostridia bacterium]|nr:MmcQ/YjbR family DNA-binding protein [Clostridia bacterium]